MADLDIVQALPDGSPARSKLLTDVVEIETFMLINERLAAQGLVRDADGQWVAPARRERSTFVAPKLPRVALGLTASATVLIVVPTIVEGISRIIETLQS